MLRATCMLRCTLCQMYTAVCIILSVSHPHRHQTESNPYKCGVSVWLRVTSKNSCLYVSQYSRAPPRMDPSRHGLLQAGAPPGMCPGSPPHAPLPSPLMHAIPHQRFWSVQLPVTSVHGHQCGAYIFLTKRRVIIHQTTRTSLLTACVSPTFSLILFSIIMCPYMSGHWPFSRHIIMRSFLQQESLRTIYNALHPYHLCLMRIGRDIWPYTGPMHAGPNPVAMKASVLGPAAAWRARPRILFRKMWLVMNRVRPMFHLS